MKIPDDFDHVDSRMDHAAWPIDNWNKPIRSELFAPIVSKEVTIISIISEDDDFNDLNQVFDLKVLLISVWLFQP